MSARKVRASDRTGTVLVPAELVNTWCRQLVSASDELRSIATDYVAEVDDPDMTEDEDVNWLAARYLVADRVQCIARQLADAAMAAELTATRVREVPPFWLAYPDCGSTAALSTDDDG